MTRRICYIAGRYRHYLPDGTWDAEAMAREVADEATWGVLAASCGLHPLMPIHGTLPVETAGVLDTAAIIEGDLSIIRRLVPEFDIILMRPGWDDPPESEGSRREYDEAVEHGLLIVHGSFGAEAVRQYLATLTGPVTAEETE